jgi:hypothetical protein
LNLWGLTDSRIGETAYAAYARSCPALLQSLHRQQVAGLESQYATVAVNRQNLAIGHRQHPVTRIYGHAGSGRHHNAALPYKDFTLWLLQDRYRLGGADAQHNPGQHRGSNQTSQKIFFQHNLILTLHE